MLKFIPALFLGWTAVLLTLILVTVGLLRRDHRFLVTAALLSFPFSLSISGFPSISIPAFCNGFLPLLFGSGFFMFRNREMFAWLLAIMLLWFTAQAGGAGGA